MKSKTKRALNVGGNRQKIRVSYLPLAKKRILLFTCFIYGMGVFLSHAQEEASVLINEIQIASKENSSHDFIELFNNSEEEFSLGGCALKKETSSGKSYSVKSFGKDDKVEPESYFLWANSKDDYAESVGADASTSATISKENCAYLECDKETIDKICWEDIPASKSLARNQEGEFIVTSEPTPKAENIFPEPKEYPKTIFFNEVLSNPEGTDENNEWVELINLGEEVVNLESWVIQNGSGKAMEITDTSTEIEPESLILVEIKDTSLSLRNKDEELFLLNPNGEEVDKVIILGSAGSGISFNRTEEGKWQWSRFLTPGKENKLNNPPTIKIKKPEQIYQNVYADFDASGTVDNDGDELKFTWEFGDGKKSYKQNTRHKYPEKGKYTVALTVDDGSEKVIESFQIKVEEFPRATLKIVKLVPNPAGTDTGKEIIAIQNLSKKTVNLKDYKIATGRDLEKLTNHPVYEDFEIKKGKTKEISNKEICRFSLINTQGAVQLRYPDGQAADEVEYKKEKILEDESYEWDEKEGWQWVGAEESTTDDTDSTDIGIDVDDVFQEVETGEEKVKPLELTLNEELEMCESVDKIKADNWKHDNQGWLGFVEKFKTNNNQ